MDVVVENALGVWKNRIGSVKRGIDVSELVLNMGVSTILDEFVSYPEQWLHCDRYVLW